MRAPHTGLLTLSSSVATAASVPEYRVNDACGSKGNIITQDHSSVARGAAPYRGNSWDLRRKQTCLLRLLILHLSMAHEQALNKLLVHASHY